MATTALPKTIGCLIKNIKDETYTLCTKKHINNPNWVAWEIEELTKDVEELIYKPDLSQGGFLTPWVPPYPREV